jgi:inorganic pyrophosphatase
MASRVFNPMIELEPFDSEFGYLNAIVDTPKGNRNKFKYDETAHAFKLGGTLPLGTVFPFDLGYVPSTRADDGDPLDVLILMDEPAFAGCLVQAKLIGVIDAEQTEDGESTRNDRLIAVAAESRNHSHIRFIGDLNSNLVHEIERFFVSYITRQRLDLIDATQWLAMTSLLSINEAHKLTYS